MTAPASADGRYELGDPLAADRVEIRDQATGEVVLTCHPYTAGRWVAWIAGPPAGPGEWIEDNDMRVCRCLHLCASHSSTLADYTSLPGVGNGQCGVEDCPCGRFDLAIGRPAVPGLDPAAVLVEMRRVVRVLGEVYFTHPDLPGKAFGRRRAAAEAAVRKAGPKIAGGNSVDVVDVVPPIG